MGLPTRTACTFRFSQPRDAFIRLEPTGLVPCRIRSWGCALQSFVPLVQPYTVSGAVCPPGVEPCPHQLQPQTASSRSRLGHKRQQRFATKRSQRRPNPRLQGLAPHESLLHEVSGLDWSRHIALLSFCPSREIVASTGGLGLHRNLPSRSLASTKSEDSISASTTGCHTRRS